MNKRNAIDAVLGAKAIAIAGVSRNKGKFGSMLFREMAADGMNVVGLNRHMDSFMDKPCYRSIEDLPEDVEALITVVKPEETRTLLEAASRKVIRKVWMQQGSESEEAITFCRENDIAYVHKECVFMYKEPVKSILRFHKSIARLFGMYQRTG